MVYTGSPLGGPHSLYVHMRSQWQHTTSRDVQGSLPCSIMMACRTVCPAWHGAASDTDNKPGKRLAQPIERQLDAI